MSSFEHPLNSDNYSSSNFGDSTRHLSNGFHDNDSDSCNDASGKTIKKSTSNQAPKISKPLRVVESTKNNSHVETESGWSHDLEIECEVEAWPEPSWIWKKDATKIKGDRYKVKVDRLGGQCFRAVMGVGGVSEEDEGVYQVLVTNPLGRVKSAVKLTFDHGGATRKKRKKQKELPSNFASEPHHHHLHHHLHQNPPALYDQDVDMSSTLNRKKDHLQQTFSLVVTGNNQLSIGLDKLNVVGPVLVTWLADGKAVVRDNVLVAKVKENGDTSKNEEGEGEEEEFDDDDFIMSDRQMAGKYNFEHFYSKGNDLLCTLTKLYINEVDESDCRVYESTIRGQEEEVKRKIEITKDLLGRLSSNKGSVLTKKKTVRAKKANHLGPVQNELQANEIKKMNGHFPQENQVAMEATTPIFPTIVIGDKMEGDRDEDEDDVVPDLPRIPSRVSSRRNSVEEESLTDQLSLLGQNLLAVFQPQLDIQRVRRDSESSDKSEPGDGGPITFEAPQNKQGKNFLTVPDPNYLDVPGDENEPPTPAHQRGRRMSAVDISKSTQQRLMRLSAASAAAGAEPPAIPDIAIYNPDMELFRQRRILQQQHSGSRRQSLAEMIPDWPTLDSVERRESKNQQQQQELKATASYGKFEVRLDVENFELQQFERRRSSLMASRRRSLAEVIPDWPQLQKPKDLKSDYWKDELEDVSARDEDSRAELSGRFSKGNIRTRWFREEMEIFHGEKYNFLVDDEGVVRLIIQRIMKEDEGRYTCLVNGTSSSALLSVEEKEYNFVRGMPTSVSVKERKTLVLECQLSDPRPAVTWSRNDEQIEYTPGLYEISRRDNRCILKIPAITKTQDGARFVCSVFRDVTCCNVTVEDPEYEFVRGLSDKDCYEKETTIFECQLNYDGAPVKWLKNGKIIRKCDGKFQKKVKGTLHRLVILNVDQSDEADYTCIVQDKSSSAKLFVSPDVVILERFESQNKLEHEALVLGVRLKNPKHYVIKWFRNGKIITEKLGERLFGHLSDIIKYSISSREEEVSTLTIDNLRLSDAGLYCCRIGDRETSARIYVEECQRPPVINSDQIPKEIVVRAGKGIKLEIPYSATPQPEAKWLKDGNAIVPSDIHFFVQQSKDKCCLSIDKSDRGDTGEYSLMLKNLCGEVNVLISVNVIGVPSEPNGPLEVINLYKDRCKLKWDKPLDLGGLPLTGYIVEAYDMTTSKCGLSFKVGEDTQCAVNALIPGHKYKFKVKATNQEGESAWLATEKEILAKDPWDPPSKPGAPEINDFDKDRAEIQWKPSERDGGSEILKYVIEKRMLYGDWQTVGMVPPTELDAIVPELTEGEEYEFRVVAVNQAGRGEYSDPSEPVTIKATKLAAKIDHTSYESSVKIKAGCDFHLEALYYGEPVPNVNWSSEKKGSFEHDEHFQIRNSQNCSMLSCIRAQRHHSSSYTISVWNAHGRDQATITVTVIDVSDVPKGPLEVNEVRKTSAVLKWQHPENTGGKPITNYVIEKKIVGSDIWERLAQFVAGNATETKLTKLKTGEAHMFRVAAENEIGISDFLTTYGSVTIQNQFGRPEPPGKPFLIGNEVNSIAIGWTDSKNKNNEQFLGYNIERKNLRSQLGEWIGLNENPLTEMTYNDEHLKPNSLFLYRIIAENEEGLSDPGTPSDVLSTLPLEEKPSINPFNVKDVTVKKGHDLKLTIPFSANPFPKAEWKILRHNAENFGNTNSRNKRFSVVGDFDLQNSIGKRRRHSISQLDGQFLKRQISCTFEPGRGFETLEAEGRIAYGIKDGNVLLAIKKSALFDSGIYKLKLSNAAGECEVSFKITVTGIPSAPEGPLEVIELTSDSVSLQWKTPSCDGGSPILRYAVEKRLPARGSKWTKVASNVKPQGRENRVTIRNLEVGVPCEFRIQAINDIGDGDFLTTLEAVVPGSAKGVPEILKNVRCNQLTDTSACLVWDDPKDSAVVGFVVEKKEKSFHYWNRVSAGAVEKNEAILKHLSQGKEYDFRVAAINHFGIGEFQVVSFSPQPMHVFASPKILLNSSSLNASFPVGQKFNIRIPFSGFPKPELTVIDPTGMPLSWHDASTTDEERIKIEKCSDTEFLLFKSCLEPSDAGTYRVHLANAMGGDEAKINISVHCPPGQPQGPLRVSNVDRTTYLISWRSPANSGGRPVTHYVVEAKEAGERKWRHLNKYCRKMELLTEDLDEGGSYEFRVSAVNEIGAGNPLMSDERLVVPASVDLPSSPDRPKIEVDKKRKITVRWSTSKQRARNAPDDFVIESRRRGSNDWSVNGKLPASIGNYYQVEEVGKSGEYQFRVRGSNKWGVGEPSLPSSFVFMGDRKLPQISGLITGVERLPSGKIRLDWQLLPQHEGKGMVLERRKVNENSATETWEILAEGALTERFVIIENDDDDDRDYEFRVRMGGQSETDHESPLQSLLQMETDDNKHNRRINGADDAEERLLTKREEKENEDPEFVMPLENISILLGDEARFMAKIKGKPWPIIKWYLNGNQVLNHSRFSITESESKGISELLIKETKSTDVGLIACELSNFYGKTSSSAKLIFLERPSFQQPLYELNLNKGDAYKLRIPFSGSSPHRFNLSIDDALWKDDDNDDDEEETNSNASLELFAPGENDDYVVLYVKKAQISMNKKIYILELTNSLATAVCEIKITVKGPPTVCKGTLNVARVTKTSCLLSWKPPSFDGGSRLEHYVVEKRDLDKPYWMSACAPTKTTQIDVQGLIEGKSYLFRVAAVNSTGTGQYLTSGEPIKARLPYGTPGIPGKPSVVDFTFRSASLEWLPSPSPKFFDDFEGPQSSSSTSPSRRISLSPPALSSTPSFEPSTSLPTTSYVVEKVVVDRENEDDDDDPPEGLSNGGINFTASPSDSALAGWTMASVSAVKITQNADERCSCVVENLIEGRSYQFRVVPFNEAGHGYPSSPSDPVLISDKTSMPTFLEPLSNLEALEGRSVELQVKIAGKPKPTITWYKGSQALVTSPSKYEMDEDDYVYTLTIKNISLDDSDEYIVRATNQLGSRTSRARLIINAPPKIQSAQLYQVPLVVDKGSSTNIRLYYSGHPLPKIEWSKDGEEIHSSDGPCQERSPEETNSSYKFPYESRQRRFSINSRFLSNGPSSAATFRHPSLSLVEKRKFDSTPRYASVHLFNVEATDKGEYTLTLTNQYGLDQATVQVKINDVPGPPLSLRAEKIQNTSLTLTWEEPVDDGGSTVTQYFVEVTHDKQRLGWLPHSLTRFNRCRVENLLQRNSYQFRVGAINVFGRGLPCQPISVTTGENTIIDDDGKIDAVQCASSSSSSSSLTHGQIDLDCYYTNLWKERLATSNHSAPLREEKLEDFYDVCEQLGRGPHGSVNRVVDKSTGRSYICHFIDLSKSGDDDNDDDQSERTRRNKDLLMDEIDNMRKLHHRKLHHLHEVFHCDDDDDDGNKMALIMEFLSGEDLLKRLSSDDERFTEEKVAKLMRQVCEGVQHLHEKNIVHLAIKPENLICPTLKSSEVKVTNFASSALLDPDRSVMITKSDIDYQAPELVDGRPIGFYTDMWSIGVVTYVLLTGKHPFEGSTRSEKMRKISECKWSMDAKKLQLSEAAKDFVANLLEKDTGMRMTVQEALDHPWLCQECTYSTKALDSSKYSKLLKDPLKSGHTPCPISIGSLAQSTALDKAQQKEHHVGKHKIDRKEVQPRFVWKPKNCSVQEGGTASFKCKVVSSDRMTVTWYKDSTQLDVISTSKYQVNSTGDHHEIKVFRVTSSDAGEYVIRAENKHGRVEEAALLTVEGGRHSSRRSIIQRSQSLEPTSVGASRSMASLQKQPTVANCDFTSERNSDQDREPTFTFSLRDRTIQEGTGFKLTASVEGHPVPKITWYKDGRELFKSSLDHVISFRHGMCTLEVEEAKVSQGGRYSCRASNSRGSNETSCNVNVYGSERRSSSRESPLRSSSSSSSSSLPSYASSYRPSYSRRYSRCSIDRW